MGNAELRLFAARCHRRSAAVFALQVNDGQTLGPADDARRQHSAPRTNYADRRAGSSCHGSLLSSQMHKIRRSKCRYGFQTRRTGAPGGTRPYHSYLPDGASLPSFFARQPSMGRCKERAQQTSIVFLAILHSRRFAKRRRAGFWGHFRHSCRYILSYRRLCWFLPGRVMDRQGDSTNSGLKTRIPWVCLSGIALALPAAGGMR